MSNTNTFDVRYEVITQEDPETGDMFIPLPPEVLRKLGWTEGTEVEFEVGKDGTIYITKK
jgi:hypothetical protein